MATLKKIVVRTLFFLFLGVVAVWTANRFLRLTHLSLFANASPEKKFMSAWADDIDRLDRAHALPLAFSDLKEVELSSPSDKLKTAFKKYPLPLKQKKKGKFNLQIFADEIDGGGIVIQYDLVDIKSGNTIWEMGRTFPQKL